MIAKKKYHSRRTCSVPQCNSVTVEGKISLMLFPKDEKLKKKWTEVSKINKKEVTKYMYICSLHFTDDDFKHGDVRASRRVLRPGVVPSVNLPRDKTPPVKLIERVNAPTKTKSKKQLTINTKDTALSEKISNIDGNFQPNQQRAYQNHLDQPQTDLSLYFNQDTPEILQDLDSPDAQLFLLDDSQYLQQESQLDLQEPDTLIYLDNAQPPEPYLEQFLIQQEVIPHEIQPEIVTGEQQDINEVYVLADVANVCNDDLPIAQNLSLNSIDIPTYQTVPTVIESIPIQGFFPLHKKDAETQADLTKHESPLILDMIRTDMELNAFTGVLSFHMLYNIAIGVEYIEKSLSIERPENYMSVLHRVLLTLIKLKLNYLPFICLSVFFKISEELCIAYFNETVAPIRVVLDYVMRYTDTKIFYKRMPKMLEKYKKVLEKTPSPVGILLNPTEILNSEFLNADAV